MRRKSGGLLLIIIILISFTGCKTILIKMYGVKKPSIETEVSIKNYALKIGLDTLTIVSVNVDDFVDIFSRRGIPEGLIFDKSGNYLEYKESDTSCNAGLFNYIPELNSNGSYNRSVKYNLTEEVSSLRNLKGQAIQEFNSSEYDFLLFIYWAKWVGKLNKDHVKEWQQLALDNKNAKIKTILINLDIQENWDKEKRDELLNSMRKAF